MPSVSWLLSFDWREWAPPLIVFVVTFGLGLLVKRLAFRSLERWAHRTKSRADDAVLASFRRPFTIWVLIFAVYLGSQFIVLHPRAALIVERMLLVLWVISLTSAAAGLASRLVRIYGSQVQGALPVTSLTQNLARLSVIAVGVLILLNIFGLSITPIITALGIGGLAVALALQDTLANFFAGFYISVANQIRIGDYIRLNTLEEGYVCDITWRSTTIRALQNNLIIVPNSKLAQAIVTNFHLPEKEMSVTVTVSVEYGSDPDRVERVLAEEAAAAAGAVPGLLAQPAPFVRFSPGFGESGLEFSLVCRVAEFTDQYLVQHELRKRILKRLRAEGIAIPFPTRTLYLAGGTAPGQDARGAGAGG